MRTGPLLLRACLTRQTWNSRTLLSPASWTPWNTGLWYGSPRNSVPGSNNALLFRKQLDQRRLNECFYDLIEPPVFGVEPNGMVGEVIPQGLNRAGDTIC